MIPGRCIRRLTITGRRAGKLAAAERLMLLWQATGRHGHLIYRDRTVCSLGDDCPAADHPDLAADVE